MEIQSNRPTKRRGRRGQVIQDLAFVLLEIIARLIDQLDLVVAFDLLAKGGMRGVGNTRLR